MPKVVSRLTSVQVRSLSEPGKYADGNGLYLQITKHQKQARLTQGKSWIFRYTFLGEPRTMGLGSTQKISLGKARELAKAAHELLADGIDPRAQRDSQRETLRKKKKQPTFSEACSQFIDAHQGSWSNPKHKQQWENTLATYAFPVIGKVGTQEITVEHMQQILEPIWLNKNETASRLRGRIERVLDWCTIHGYRTGDNPARWRGFLEHAFPPRNHVRQVRHHPALPWRELPDLITQLETRNTVGSRALMFGILTASRSGEVRFAVEEEFDFVSKTWTVPASRMKTKREHRVPLSSQALDLIHDALPLKPGWVFSNRPGKPLSENGTRVVLKELGYDNITVHGFRSTFRDWVAEETSFPREVAEQCLAHQNRDRVESAYLRSDILEKRRILMQAWSDFAHGVTPKSNVLSIQSA